MAMAASSFGGASNMMLMRNSGPNSLVAMLSSCNPHVGFQVPRSTGGLEDAIAGCGGQKRAFYPTFEDQVELEDVDEDIGFTSHGGPVEKKRRLSFDQVRSLERNFEMENKLEPERKMQLAKDLGLQPRQVAVWFQNRRARWKTKQLERDYEMLNSGYLKLKADFETALREKDALKAEIQRLSGDSQSVDSTPPCKSEVAKAKCAPVAVEDSTVDSSSELLDSDSPRTTAGTTQQQALPQQQQQQQEELFVTAAAPEEAFNVKMEDGPFQVDPSCNYFLPPMMPLPWWDSFA